MNEIKRLFDSNTRLVYKVFHEKIESKHNAINMKDDLLQIGMLSLWRCCVKFDPTKNTKFSTYAYSAIYKSMSCALVRESKKIAYLVSLSKQVNSEAEECPITYEDVIASPVNIESQVEIDDLVDQLSFALGENTKKVIDMVRQGHRQVDIAKELDMTQAGVGKILKKFRKKLKNTLFFED